MQEEKRSIGYLCPACHQPVLEEKTVFALTAGPTRVACSCGGSSLEVETDGRRFRLWVPCGLCGKTHRAECEASQLLQGRGLGLACPESGQLCCYVGDESRVRQALEQLRITEEKMRRGQENEQEPELFVDSVIMHEVLSELKEIAARPDGICCRCGSRRYSMTVRHTAVDIQCAQCGAKLRIPAATDEDLDQLCCRMCLEIPGQKK